MPAREEWPEGPSTTAVVSPAGIDGPVVGRLSLFLLRGANVESWVIPPGGSLVVGRGRDAECVIEERSVSRRHARIHRGDSLTVEDLGSHNGTYVGPHRLQPNRPVPIEVDQVIRFGSTTAVVLPTTDARPGDELAAAEEFERAFQRACSRARKLGHDAAVFHVRTGEPLSDAEVHRLSVDTLPRCALVTKDGDSDYRALCTESRVVECEAAARRLASRLREVTSDAGVVVRFFPRADSDSDTQPGKGDSLIVVNQAMVELYENVRRLAQGTISILVNGETGVGKERVVEAVHRESPRRDKPFLRLNCAAFTESLLESQLFGHEKGAFTGATGSQAGLLETASGGTVFLDEVGELSVSAQVKLLRCLEDGVVMRVGAVKPRPIDVRFVAATNRDLQKEVERGRFREDLYYRIAAATLKVPPLRERVDEIEPLARLFIERASSDLAVPPPALSDEALHVLRCHVWPGNIREFRNVIERAVLLCNTETIEPQQLPLEPGESADFDATTPAEVQTLPGGTALTESDRKARAEIVDALAEAGGNQTKAARLLGISRVTLGKRLDRYAIPRPRKSR